MRRALILGALTLVLFTAIGDGLQQQWIAVANGPNSGAKLSIEEKRYPLSQLQEDFNQLRKIIEKRHPKIYVDPQELFGLFATQYELLRDQMTELEFYRVLSPLVGSLRCGHTNLVVSKAYEDYLRKNGRFLPVLIRVIDDRAYVLQDLSGQGIPAGAEILMINGQKTADIISALLPNLTADGYNTSKKDYLMNHWFNGLYHYFIDNAAQFTLVYRGTGNEQTVTKTVDGINNQQLPMTTMSIYYPRGNNLYTSAFTEDYALLSIKSFSLRDKKKYRAFIDAFFQEVAVKEISHLILDLRDNWGGSPYYSSYLLSYLISTPTTYFSEPPFYYAKYKKPIQPAEHRFTGRLYVLINGASFSTTGHLCSLLKSHGIGVFIGEESGGSYLCTDASINVTLRHTKLRLHCATTAFATTVSNLPPGRGIEPDYRITPTLQDYLEGTDPQMKLAVQLIDSAR
ncbi:MAG: hypothetical protein GX202_05340 [Firmicutes bacterium]|nr:hypothetical protein [Bacillota bacterium]